MNHFLLLDQDQKRQAIRRMSNSGMTDYVIASATKLSVEMVRKILGEPPK